MCNKGSFMNVNYLSTGDKHYVVRCKESKEIEVGFGNVILCFNSFEFKEFTYKLSQFEPDMKCHYNLCGKCIVINYRPGTDDIMLAFDRTEFENLKKMFIESSLLLEAYELLESEERNDKINS